MSCPIVKNYLDGHHVKYNTIKHSPAYTAQEVAQSAHIPGKEMAKCVMVKADSKLVMVVLPANTHINFTALEKSLGAKHVTLASEYEFKNKFPDCDVGAMPPLGHLFSIDMFVTDDLMKDDKIAFNAGTHDELFEMQLKDFMTLESPTVIHC